MQSSSIDNMPTQLPREATDFFGDLLLPHVPDILKSDANQILDDTETSKLGPVVSNAVITSNGHLTPNFKYIDDLRKSHSSASFTPIGDFKGVERKVLVLGAGYVSGPVVDYLTRDESIGVTVAAALKEEAQKLANKYPRTEPVLLNVEERPDKMTELIADHDLVISLLPWPLHPKVAKDCIAHKTDMVTASYCTDAMRELHKEAMEAGVTVVNEVGADPGIDHLLAMECFDEVHNGGGRVEKFVSYCGGLPAPESSDNPLGYKFSWSPRGALMNMLAGAKYLYDGNVVTVEPNGGLLDSVTPMDFLPGFHLEGYPNRDSTIYGELYGISEASTIVRGTLRYKGYTDAVKGLIRLGLLSPEPHPLLHEQGPNITWRQLMCQVLGLQEDLFYDNLLEFIADRIGSQERMRVIVALGLTSDKPVEKMGSPLNTLSNHLAQVLNFGSDEKDLLLMRHEITIKWPDHRREERGINLVVYGDTENRIPNPEDSAVTDGPVVEKPIYTAMAKCVGFPAGIAAKMVLDKEIQRTGMVYPFSADIYKPMLMRLDNEGIRAKEKSKFL